jgi:hypothetical protein
MGDRPFGTREQGENELFLLPSEWNERSLSRPATLCAHICLFQQKKEYAPLSRRHCGQERPAEAPFRLFHKRACPAAPSASGGVKDLPRILEIVIPYLRHPAPETVGPQPLDDKEPRGPAGHRAPPFPRQMKELRAFIFVPTNNLLLMVRIGYEEQLFVLTGWNHFDINTIFAR